MAPSMYDLGMLFGVLILAPETGYQIGPISLPAFGLGVYGLVYGSIIGAVMFLLIQVPGLVIYKFHWTPAINLHHPGVRKVLALMGPCVLTVFFIQLVSHRHGQHSLLAGAWSGICIGIWMVVHASS